MTTYGRRGSRTSRYGRIHFTDTVADPLTKLETEISVTPYDTDYLTSQTTNIDLDWAVGSETYDSVCFSQPTYPWRSDNSVEFFTRHETDETDTVGFRYADGGEESFSTLLGRIVQTDSFGIDDVEYNLLLDI